MRSLLNSDAMIRHCEREDWPGKRTSDMKHHKESKSRGVRCMQLDTDGEITSGSDKQDVKIDFP